MVSTSMGVEGIPVENGKHAAVADTVEAFAAAAIRMYDDEAWRRKIGQAAQQLVMENFDRRSVTTKIDQILSAAARLRAITRILCAPCECLVARKNRVRSKADKLLPALENAFVFPHRLRGLRRE